MKRKGKGKMNGERKRKGQGKRIDKEMRRERER